MNIKILLELPSFPGSLPQTHAIKFLPDFLLFKKKNEKPHTANTFLDASKLNLDKVWERWRERFCAESRSVLV